MNRAAVLIATILVALTALVDTSCSDRHDDYGDFTPVPAEGWSYGDTVSFLAAGLDSVPAPRKLKVGVIHNNDYRYSNLYLEVTCRKDRRYWRDTVELKLADVYGAWLGRGIGPSYQVEATISPAIVIADSTRVSVRHIMRLDTVKGIERVGVIIDR